MGKREENARMTRQKLLATADQLIVHNGYEDVSVDSIVQASGIAKGTFYNYFKRKEDLIFELSKERFAGIATQPIQLRNGCVAAVGAYLLNFIAIVANSKVELTRQWVHYVSATADNQQKWSFDVHSLETLLEKFVTEGQMKSETPIHELANLLLTQMYGIILTWCMSPELIDPIETTKNFNSLQLKPLFRPYLVK